MLSLADAQPLRISQDSQMAKGWSELRRPASNEWSLSPLHMIDIGQML